MPPVVSFYTNAEGRFVANFSVMLEEGDIESIAYKNWKVGFKPVDLVLYMMNTGINKCKIEVPALVLWHLAMPVDYGKVYTVRKGTNNRDGKPVFWLDYEVVVRLPPRKKGEEYGSYIYY